MTISVKIIGVAYNSYGQQYPIGSTQVLTDDYASSLIAAGLATATVATAYPALTSPLFDSYMTGTMAQMMAIPPAAGMRFHTSDTYFANGSPNPMGNDWVGDGAVWRPRGYQRVLTDSSLTTGTQTTGEQIVNKYLLPAGLLYLQRFLLEVTVAKTGGTDIMNTVNVRLGPNGTTADAVLSATSGTAMAAGKRSTGLTGYFESQTAGSLVIKHGSGGGMDNGSFLAMSVNNVAQTTALITGGSLQTTPMFLSITCNMAAATADSPQIGGVFLTLTP